MISEKYIMEQLARFIKTKEGKKIVKEKTGKQNTLFLESYGVKMKDILYNHIRPIISSFEKDDIIISEIKTDKNGVQSLKIAFDEEALKRKSLIPEVYSGIENIVLLFSKGYEANTSVQGTWERTNGQTFDNVWSRKERPANDFLQRAVQEFNNETKGKVIASLEGEYNQ